MLYDSPREDRDRSVLKGLMASETYRRTKLCT